MAYCQIRNVVGCKLLQSDIDSVQNRCLENGMVLNFGKITFLSFTHKTVVINFKYKLYFPIVLKTLEFCSNVRSVFVVTLTTYFSRFKNVGFGSISRIFSHY